MSDILCVGVYSFLIKKKKIIITGTSSGIGKKLTQDLLRNNNIVWGCSRGKTIIKNRNYKHTRIDLTNFSSLKKWIKKIEIEAGGKIDLLICNAAIMNRVLNLNDNIKNIVKTINTNLSTNIILASLVSKIMIKKKEGTIIFFSSVAKVINEEGSSTYSASKSGIETFSIILAKELKKFNIKVHSFRIMYLPTRLSQGLSLIKLKNILKKFKSNMFKNEKKILNKINIILNKNLNLKTIIYDKTN